MSQPLHALRLPLWGSRLIEASAGTGKTWTIAALYLRLVLGHGAGGAGGAGDTDASEEAEEADAGFGRPLLPADILVMTFTRAATRELSDRIRARLLEAARCFRGETAAGDPLLADLLAAHPPGVTRTHAAWRLASAAESMDDAAIHTIDGWCQRMLREHAFDSGCLFDEELTAHEAAMLGEATHDYWRQQVYPLSDTLLDAALAIWRDTASLAEDARALREQVLPAGAGHGTLAECIARAVAAQQAALARLKAGWAERVAAMRQWLDIQMAAEKRPFHGNKLQARTYPGWLDALEAWATSPHLVEPALSDAARARLTPAGMHDACNKGVSVELPEYFAAFEELLQALAGVPVPSVQIRLHAAAHITGRLAYLKQQAGSFGFADMLHRLDQALDPARDADAAARLRARILLQYPVALIDEFQDTSPIQARIFDRLYRIADNHRQTALLLIGDPKQSIYGFRGADIHAYLQARRATSGRHYMLDTNHRSTASMVAALNRLLAHPEQRPDGEGTFRYRVSAAENPLPFLPVQARGRPERFVQGALPVPAVTLALDAALDNMEGSRKAFAGRCAERITALLNQADAGFEQPGAPFQRLRPADIAVLVRTGKEAQAVQRELQRRGVASVYLSDQQSVFSSAEAQDLLRWLRAVAAPLDVRLVRAALATRSVGLSLEALQRLAEDDEAFDARSEQLRELHGVWQQQGVLAMLRRTLHLLELPARWLGTRAAGSGEPDGERRLTNFLHLAELLQAASAQLDSEPALVRWLAGQIQGQGERNDDHIVRLESDSDLVKVVTVWAAKGLEYPLVFLPFASSYRAVEKRGTRMLNLADDAGARTLHLQFDSRHIESADRERHREDLRLLYVALTRARHAVWVGLAALKVGNGGGCKSHLSAIGYLLHGEAVHEDALAARIAAMADGCPDIRLEDAAATGSLTRAPLRQRAAPAGLREATAYAGVFERDWSIGSFSGLVRDLAWSGSAAASEAVVRDDERVELLPDDTANDADAGEALRAPAAAAAADPAAPWHRFPRGALPGNFLHDQMEWLATEGFDLAGSGDRALQLQRRCERLGWGERAPDLLAWLQAVVSAELPPIATSLDRIGGLLPEMEFWFPVDRLDAAALDRLCRQELLGGRSCPTLPGRELKGMLMGFADLVFEHAGRYWVLDYKSNHLGDDDAAYAAPALQAAMAEHRYDVQGALYLFALHRLLRSRLGAAYLPGQHLGGAVFFFLRGVQADTRGCHHVQPTAALLEGMERLMTLPPEAAA